MPKKRPDIRHPWTDEEREKLRELFAAGDDDEAIGEKMDRTPEAIGEVRRKMRLLRRRGAPLGPRGGGARYTVTVSGPNNEVVATVNPETARQIMGLLL